LDSNKSGLLKQIFQFQFTTRRPKPSEHEGTEKYLALAIWASVENLPKYRVLFVVQISTTNDGLGLINQSNCSNCHMAAATLTAVAIEAFKEYLQEKRDSTL